MSRSITTKWKAVVVVALAASVAWSCTEDQPTAPNGESSIQNGIERSTILTALSCNADIATRRIACGRLGENALEDPSSAGGPGEKANIIIGGQGVYVSVQTSNVQYNGGTGAFTFDATIRNLIPQPLGTADTIPPSADPDVNGVRLFFAQGPTVTGGTGLITVVPDGFATFTAPDQPYYQYSTVLDQFEISSPKTWQLNMPNTVTSFSFVLLVSAAVPRPDGYIDLQVAGSTATPPTDRQVSWFVRNANGTLAGDQSIMTWSSSDPTRATINSSGLIDPLRAGQTIITAISSDGLRVGYLTLTVKPIRRTWTGAVSTDWHTGGNWSPDNIVPVATDTAVIPDALAQYPLLTQNTSIGGIDVMGPGGTIGLANFDLTASGDIKMPGAGDIIGPGRLILAGFSNTINGIAPRTLVTGRYSLDANLTVSQQIRVQSGRFRAQGFRLRQVPF